MSSLGLALRVAGSAVAAVWTHFGLSLAGNVVAAILSLPLLLLAVVLARLAGSLVLVPLGVAVLAGILPSPALAGLQYLARELVRREPLYFGDLWDGLRRYWVTALRCWLLAAAVTVIIFLNLLFYGSSSRRGGVLHLIGGPVALFWLVVLVCWLLLHLYVFPLLLAQEQPSVLLAYRNAGVIAVSRPLFTAMLGTFWLAFVIFAAASGLIAALGLALAAILQQAALARLLPSFHIQPRD